MTNKEIQNAYVGDTQVEKIYLGTDIVWPTIPTDLIVTYNVTSTTKTTRLMTNTSSYLEKIVIDDEIEIPRQSAATAWQDYRFSTTGQHTARFIESKKVNIPSFDSCNSITGVFIPEDYKKIGMNAFQSCTGLTTIDIPNSVTAITDGGNFVYCGRLRTVNIGSGITEFGNQVFMGCSVLTAITINAVTPPKIGTSVLHAAANAYFYVPDEAVEAYKAAPTWANYADRVKGISEKPQ